MVMLVYQRVNGTDMNRDLQVATRGYPIIPSLGKPGKKVRIRKGWRRSTEHNMKQQRTCQLFYAFLVLLVFTSIDIDSSRFQSFNLTDLTGYAYMLGLSTAVAYVPLFWAILLVLLKTGAAPMSS